MFLITLHTAHFVRPATKLFQVNLKQKITSSTNCVPLLAQLGRLFRIINTHKHNTCARTVSPQEEKESAQLRRSRDPVIMIFILINPCKRTYIHICIHTCQVYIPICTHTHTHKRRTRAKHLVDAARHYTVARRPQEHGTLYSNVSNEAANPKVYYYSHSRITYIRRAAWPRTIHTHTETQVLQVPRVWKTAGRVECYLSHSHTMRRICFSLYRQTSWMIYI